MNTAAKKQKNREYYLKNREKILSRARERNNSRQRDHLEIVPKLRSEDARSADSSAFTSDLAQTSEKLHQLSNSSERQLRGTSSPGNAQAIAADGTWGLYDVVYEFSPRSIDNSFTFSGKGTQMEQTLRPVNGMPLKLKVSDTENSAAKSFVCRKRHLFRKIPLSFMIRLLLVACLTLLMTAMQVEFYREHDILPGYAVPLALASEVAFLSLVSMKFSRSLEWLRVFIHLVFFGYFVSALSFHVYAKTREKAASQPSVTPSEMTEVKEQLKQTQMALQVATKGRAWKTMEILSAETSRLRSRLDGLPNYQVLGASSDQFLGMEVGLLVIMRALLLVASALNMLRLRDQFYDMLFT
jgi:hypothetical protein